MKGNLVKRPIIFHNAVFSSHFSGWTEINFERISGYSAICLHFSAHAHVYFVTGGFVSLFLTHFIFILFFFFAFIPLSHFVLSFVFVSFPLYLSVRLRSFSRSFTVKQSTAVTQNKPSQKSSAHVYFIIATFPSGLLCSVRAVKQRHKQTYRRYGLHITRNLNSCLFRGPRESGTVVRLG
jgi:hypothetical protein